MLTKNEWQTVEEDLENLKKQRAELDEKIKELRKEYEQKKKEIENIKRNISKTIHVEEMKIKQHYQKHAEPKIKTDTAVYQMFGKPLKELTKEEYKIYYNARQRINRQKRKEKKAI